MNRSDEQRQGEDSTRTAVELRRYDWNAKAERWYAEIRKGKDEQGSNRYGKGTVEIGGALSGKSMALSSQIRWESQRHGLDKLSRGMGLSGPDPTGNARV